MSQDIPSRLKRHFTSSDAVIASLSAMLGSGIFVAIGPAVLAAGVGVLLGVLLAAGVAFCSATSSAQLAAAYPESGGTYLYGRKLLGPGWGSLAGTVFILAKISSCAAAALAFGQYIHPSYGRQLALGAIFVLLVVNLFGIRKTITLTWGMTFFILIALFTVIFVSLFGGTADITQLDPRNTNISLFGIMRSAGLMFFAFAGFARIATMAEEVRDPRRTIPAAMMKSLVLITMIYLLVIASVLMAIGPYYTVIFSAPLVEVVNAGGFWRLNGIVRMGAIVATLGVALSLIAAISRTLFAMASAGDLPKFFAAIHARYKVPSRALWLTAIVIGLLIWFSHLFVIINHSAMLILMYYAITHVCALKLSRQQRLWPRFLAVFGLVFSVLLALSLSTESVIFGLIIVAVFLLKSLLQRFLFKKR